MGLVRLFPAIGDGMSNLQTRCLGYLPLPKEQVESIWSGNTSFDRQESMSAIAQLCLSHERLRAELEGLEIVLKTVAP